jgi:hypothetical protein
MIKSKTQLKSSTIKVPTLSDLIEFKIKRRKMLINLPFIEKIKMIEEMNEEYNGK